MTGQLFVLLSRMCCMQPQGIMSSRATCAISGRADPGRPASSCQLTAISTPTRRKAALKAAEGSLPRMTTRRCRPVSYLRNRNLWGRIRGWRRTLPCFPTQDREAETGGSFLLGQSLYTSGTATGHNRKTEGAPQETRNKRKPIYSESCITMAVTVFQ